LGLPARLALAQQLGQRVAVLGLEWLQVRLRVQELQQVQAKVQAKVQPLLARWVRFLSRPPARQPPPAERSQ
jgi:hypothetical protein